MQLSVCIRIKVEAIGDESAWRSSVTPAVAVPNDAEDAIK